MMVIITNTSSWPQW